MYVEILECEIMFLPVITLVTERTHVIIPDQNDKEQSRVTFYDTRKRQEFTHMKATLNVAVSCFFVVAAVSSDPAASCSITCTSD